MTSPMGLSLVLLLIPFSLVTFGCGPSHPAGMKGPVKSVRSGMYEAVFRDLAEEAGLKFKWGHSGRSPLNILDTAGGGCAFLDYDGDGLLDVLFVGTRLGLFHNDGNGRFRDVSAGSGLDVTGTLMGCAVGDYNNDGRPDIFISGFGTVRLYQNAGGGKFTDITFSSGLGPKSRYAWATSAGYADLDGDGFLDLVVCHYVTFSPQSRQLCDYPDAAGNGRVFAACPPLYYEPQKLSVFRNLGNGRFVDMTSGLPSGHGNNLGIAFADFDGDGKIDFYVANDALPGDLYHNLGNWKFENVGTASATALNQDGGEQAGMGVDWGDYDGDGRLDLILTTFQNEPRSLYHNEGNGLFSYSSYRAGIGDLTKSRLGFGGGFIDYDNDSFPDLLFANGHVQDTINKIHPPATYAQSMQLFHNLGDGSFKDESARAGSVFGRQIVGRAVAFGDFDNDGKVDVLIVDSEGGPILLHNESRTANHWLGIRLISRYGGRDAIGALVTVETAHIKRIAECQTCRSYLASCDPRVHFGLGADSVVRKLSVRWPGGKTTVLKNVTADGYITIKETQAH